MSEERNSKEIWSHSVGRGANRVTVFEMVTRKSVLYLRWKPKGSDKFKHESLVRELRTKEGRLIQENVRFAKAKAQERHEELVAGVSERERVEDIPLSLSEGLERAMDPKTGKYPVSTVYSRSVRAEVEFAMNIFGRDKAWASMHKAELRALARARLESIRKRSAEKLAERKAKDPSLADKLIDPKDGLRGAEFCVQAVIAIATWLRGEDLIPANACIPEQNWKRKLAGYYAEKYGGGVERTPQRDRYTADEMRAMLRTAWKVDPRFDLLMGLGAELRLGQVRRARRSHLLLEHGEFHSPGRGKKRGAVVELTKGQLNTVDRALNGYLRDFEAAYRRGEIKDYNLFPAGQLTGGRKYREHTRQTETFDVSLVPAASVERHAKAPALGKTAIQKWALELEQLLGIPHIEGRLVYGLRRRLTDEAAPELSPEGIKAHGGWDNIETPMNIYRDQQSRAGRGEAKATRAKIRGEEEA